MRIRAQRPRGVLGAIESGFDDTQQELGCDVFEPRDLSEGHRAADQLGADLP
jgi:hypothetical protein